MTIRGPTGLFVDTSAFYARFVENAPRHEAAMDVFDAIAMDEVPFRPLFTSSFVCSELATLLQRKGSHAVAVDALDRIRTSDAIRICHPSREGFTAVCHSFERFADQTLSFVDHSTAVLASRHEVRHVFAFDDDFRVFDLSLVPDDVDL